MAKEKSLKQEQGVSMLVIESWSNDSHSREGPLTNNIKHKTSAPGRVAAGNNKSKVAETNLAGTLSYTACKLPSCLGRGKRRLPGQAIQSSLEDALVGLHGLWREQHCGKGMGATPNTHLVGFHIKDVQDAGGHLGWGTRWG